MKKILILLLGIVFWGLGIASIQAQDIPDIPDFDSGGDVPPVPKPATAPTPKPVTPPKPAPAYTPQATRSHTADTSEESIEVKPDSNKEIGGAPVFDAAQMFMQYFKFEALFSSKSWISHWLAPDMGLLRVTTLPQPIGVSRGSILRWQRDPLGNPMVYLRAQVNFPRILPPDAASAEQPLGSVPITIAQAVVFHQRPGGWMANASPIYVTMKETEDKKITLVPLQRGQALWRAWVGHGGIYVENFLGAGLSAARTELNQRFRDEEIRLFVQGNSDVIFYLRPQSPTAVKTSTSIDLTNP
ncbi:MAG: hypothetical protein ACOY3I_08440 [Verrucomicrobiota bacterium]